MGLRILVMGGTGLISTAITGFLVERGDDVTLFNRGIREQSVPEWVTVIRGDRMEEDSFERQVRNLGRFDCVMDMICFKPGEARSAIRAFAGETEQFIFCSTVDVYTKPAKWYPVTEDHERKPASSFPYAHDKAVCESLFEEADARRDFSVTIIRPAQTYGGPIHTFRGDLHVLRRIREGRPVILHGDGRSLWCACHRDDVARAFVNAVGNKQAYGKAYHVTGEEWMTWDQYWAEIATVMNAPGPRFVHIPSDVLGRVWPNRASWCVENFQFNNVFDNSAARRDLGFQYTISWREGMSHFVQSLNWDAIEESPDYYDALITEWEDCIIRLRQRLEPLDE